MDQKIGKYTTKSTSPRWSMVAFAYMLDTIRVNATSLLALTGGSNIGKVDSFKCGWDLVMSLVTPAIEARSRNGLSSNVQMKMDHILGQCFCTTSLFSQHIYFAYRLINFLLVSMMWIFGIMFITISRQLIITNMCCLGIPRLSAVPTDALLSKSDIKFEEKSELPRNCSACKASTIGVGQKKKKDSLHRVKAQCQICEDACCPRHSVIVCNNHVKWQYLICILFLLRFSFFLLLFWKLIRSFVIQICVFFLPSRQYAKSIPAKFCTIMK